ncbi:HAMP domain-containing histidine kinase [Sphingomonas ginsenosidivorax]|uniref:histidine kinase n=1 Tax=Sphingomonas ginsenosidivorax TaxID=862135 RepID=A0A5C6UHI6_9SPHN|nr:HAMP domain-containing sensor histidine kinase [Sphingomonas ginsenosidivorax]TXC72217.1 HAMP domain-containing histidine kinase [Sphingomonas ginsenosidivorax]
MSLLRPSLVRRLALGFAFGAVSVSLMLLALLTLWMVGQPAANAGPSSVIELLTHDLTRAGGRLMVKPGSRIFGIARRSPPLWIVGQDSNGNATLLLGRPPAQTLAAIRSLPIQFKTADLGKVDSPDRTTDFSIREIVGPGGSVTLFVGGVRPGAVTAMDWMLGFFLRDVEFYISLGLICLTSMAGAPFAIPIVLYSVRPVAKAAGRLDPSDLDGRLSEHRVVKEILPLVRAFNAVLDRLSHVFDQRRRFIADVAHELRAPLAVLSAQIETVPDDPRRVDLQRTLYRLNQMVGQMLDVERLTLAGRRREPVDLVALAREATADVAPLALSSGYEIAFSAERETAIVEGDWHAITRAVSNLLGNAIAHGDAAGTIEVRVTDDRAIEVSDEGPGVPPDARTRIFEPFHRERWDRDGCGLGLHLVQEIMASHGGKAAVVGNGPGATFRLSFDRAQDALIDADG